MTIPEDTSTNATPPTITPEDWAIHGQLTNITQHHPSFSASYSGQQSLTSLSRTEETTDMTLFLGKRLWKDGEIWINAEVDQGHGFNDTLGLAGFPNGGAYKLGANQP